METFINRKEMQLIASQVRKRCKTFTKRKDWFIRIKTPLPQTGAMLTAKDYKAVLQDALWEISAQSFQICLEGSNETDHHIQMCVKFAEGSHEQDIKAWVREQYDKMINILNKDVKKISTFYSCVRIRENALRAMAYNYKEDSHVLEYNLDSEDVKIAKMLSHGKDLRQLSKQIESLKEKYFRDELTNKGLAREILKLKAQFNQSININNITNMIRCIMIRKNPLYADVWADEILSRIMG